MKFIFLSLLIFILIAPSAQAIGVAIDPGKFDIVYTGQETLDLKINNISEEPISVSVAADDFSDQVHINPAEFVLLPEEIMVVNIDLNFDDQTQGIKRTDLSVISKALDRKSFNAASGIKIPLTIAIVAAAWQWNAGSIFLLVFFGLLFVGLIFQLLFILWRPRKKHHFLSLDFLWHHKKYRNFWKKFRQ